MENEQSLHGKFCRSSIADISTRRNNKSEHFLQDRLRSCRRIIEARNDGRTMLTSTNGEINFRWFNKDLNLSQSMTFLNHDVVAVVKVDG